MRKDSFFLQKKGNHTNKQNKDKGDKKGPREKEFDKNRDLKEKETKNEKKPFDKKTYRLKKYSKKYKLEQWEEQRKKRLLQEYQKSIKNDPMAGKYVPKSFDDEVDSVTEAGKFVRHPDVLAKQEITQARKKDPFLKAKEQLNKVKQEKQEKKMQLEREKEERNQKLQEYKKKKTERFKKLSKKNKKGQPMMTGRLELLLEKIQKG